MTDYSIGEAAKILHVTTRTLRHWDAVGLLTPSWRTWSDHRLYTHADIQRGMDILIYRGAGLSLADIAVVLDSSCTESTSVMLQHQRTILMEKIGQLHDMVRALDAIMNTEDFNQKELTVNYKISKFGAAWPGYQEEARQRWGDTPEWTEAQKEAKGLSAEDMEKISAEHAAFAATLTNAVRTGVKPGTPAASEVVEAHRASISGWYEVSRARQLILAQMYTEDARFDEAYGGHATYLFRLIKAVAEAEGLDVSNVSWND